MKEIGGYFELDTGLEKHGGYHSGALELNSCRNSIALIVRQKKYSKVYIPSYICDAVPEAILASESSIEFYRIDGNFEIEDTDNINLKKNEALLYVNYFGLKDVYTKKLKNQFATLIIDNAQSFYSTGMKSVETVYSPRKFFGVPDGGYVVSDYNFSTLCIDKVDESYKRFAHLLKRADIDPDKGYDDFVDNEQLVSKLPIKTMSRLTSKILSNIEFEKYKSIRKLNYKLLSMKLSESNDLQLSSGQKENAPMAYPFLHRKGNVLRKTLINNNVYVPTYWPEVLNRVKDVSVEANFVKNLVPLPIDHRYGKEDMLRIVDLVLSFTEVK